MSFAEELRNAPNEKKQRNEKDWKDLTRIFVDQVKSTCKYVAENGGNNCNVYLNDLVTFIENSYTEKYTEGGVWNVEFYGSRESQLWSRLRDQFFHYVFKAGEKAPHSSDYISKGDECRYPYIFGMSMEKAGYLSDLLKNYLEKEGLSVNIDLREEEPKLRNEMQYVKYTSALDILLSGEGYYENTVVIDEKMYSLDLHISW